MADALIWGASGGMGKALVTQLQDAGWRVFAAARDKDAIPSDVFARYQFEAGSVQSIRAVALDLAHESKGIDLWVYAAGELQANMLRKMDPESWSAVLDSNLTGAFLTSSHTMHLLNDGAQAAFIGAYVDHLILPKMGAYAVAKAGLEPLVSVLQKENRKVNFTLVKPGAVDTDFWQNAPFKKPANAKAPQIVAQAIIDQYHNGGRGVLAL